MAELKKLTMKKEFLPYDLEVKLVELGFNEKTFDVHSDIVTSGFKVVKKPTPRILFQQAFRFFREKYNIHYAMKPILGSKNGYDSFPILGWDYDIFITNKGTQNSYYMGYPVGEWFTATLDMFDESETLEDLDIHPLTYEEAEVECLVKLIEIAKEQNVK